MKPNTLPKIGNYGQYSSDNYGVHTRYISLANITLYYSYETIVAYEDCTDGLVVCKNVWSTTTGKHLNWIDNGQKDTRKDSETFESMLKDACKRHNI